MKRGKYVMLISRFFKLPLSHVLILLVGDFMFDCDVKSLICFRTYDWDDGINCLRIKEKYSIKGQFENVVIFKIIFVNYVVGIINCEENQLSVW